MRQRLARALRDGDTLLDERSVPAYVDGADVLTDDHPPADQLAAR